MPVLTGHRPAEILLRSAFAINGPSRERYVRFEASNPGHDILGELEPYVLSHVNRQSEVIEQLRKVDPVNTDGDLLSSFSGPALPAGAACGQRGSYRDCATGGDQPLVAAVGRGALFAQAARTHMPRFRALRSVKLRNRATSLSTASISIAQRSRSSLGEQAGTRVVLPNQPLARTTRKRRCWSSGSMTNPRNRPRTRPSAARTTKLLPGMPSTSAFSKYCSLGIAITSPWGSECKLFAEALRDLCVGTYPVAHHYRCKTHISRPHRLPQQCREARADIQSRQPNHRASTESIRWS